MFSYDVIIIDPPWDFEKLGRNASDFVNFSRWRRCFSTTFLLTIQCVFCSLRRRKGGMLNFVKNHRNPYAVRWSKFADGERMPFLVRAATGLPLQAPTYWIVSKRRPSGSQPNTLHNELRALMYLHLWADARGVDGPNRSGMKEGAELAEVA
jgi:hypothetical protein